MLTVHYRKPSIVNVLSSSRFYNCFNIKRRKVGFPYSVIYEGEGRDLSDYWCYLVYLNLFLEKDDFALLTISCHVIPSFSNNSRISWVLCWGWLISWRLWVHLPLGCNWQPYYRMIQAICKCGLICITVSGFNSSYKQNWNQFRFDEERNSTREEFTVLWIYPNLWVHLHKSKQRKLSRL